MVDNNIPPNKARKSQNYHPHAHLQHRCQQYNYCHYRQNSIETAPKSKIWQYNQTNTKMYINMTKCAEIVVMLNALQTLPATHKTKHLFCKHFQIASNDAVWFLNWKFLIFFWWYFAFGCALKQSIYRGGNGVQISFFSFWEIPQVLCVVRCRVGLVVCEIFLFSLLPEMNFVRFKLRFLMQFVSVPTIHP